MQNSNSIQISQVSNDETLNLAINTVNMKKQAIIFASSKASCEKNAREISKYLKKNNQAPNIALSEEILKVIPHPTSQCEKLSESVKFGVAFHHSGLHYKQREIIENAFRNGQIKIIVATPTLAAGVSLPAFRTILTNLKRFSGYGMSYIPVLEYMQQAGRAGRPEYDTFGEAIIISKSEKEKEALYEKYICGVPEEITSKLAVEPVLKTYVLSLISTGFTRTNSELLDFFKDTFWAHQFGDFYELSKKIEKVLIDLIDYGFVEKQNSDAKSKKSSDLFKSAAEILKKKEITTELNSTLIGSRISELYIDPDSAHLIIESLKKADKNASAFSYLFMLFLTNQLKPNSSLSNKDFDKMHVELLKKDDDNFLTEKVLPEDDLYFDYLNCFKSAFIIELWINEYGENLILENYGMRPGELNEKLSRLDWLIYAAGELAKLISKKELITPLNKLRIRIKNGVKEELLNLLQLKGIGRVRARKLFANNVKSISDLKKTDYVLLSQIVGEKISRNIKEQIGDKIIEQNHSSKSINDY
jgi:helicase